VRAACDCRRTRAQNRDRARSRTTFSARPGAQLASGSTRTRRRDCRRRAGLASGVVARRVTPPAPAPSADTRLGFDETGLGKAAGAAFPGSRSSPRWRNAARSRAPRRSRDGRGSDLREANSPVSRSLPRVRTRLAFRRAARSRQHLDVELALGEIRLRAPTPRMCHCSPSGLANPHTGLRRT